jgi:hypothetical protein
MQVRVDRKSCGDTSEKLIRDAPAVPKPITWDAVTRQAEQAVRDGQASE